MTYELAKQLKDAGFPQHSDDVMDAVWIPTLNELIEACMKSHPAFRMLWHIGGTWIANSYLGEDESFNFGPRSDKTGEGSTPEEAVAKLWLAMNKK